MRIINFPFHFDWKLKISHFWKIHIVKLKKFSFFNFGFMMMIKQKIILRWIKIFLRFFWLYAVHHLLFIYFLRDCGASLKTASSCVCYPVLVFFIFFNFRFLFSCDKILKQKKFCELKKINFLLKFFMWFWWVFLFGEFWIWNFENFNFRWVETLKG